MAVRAPAYLRAASANRALRRPFPVAASTAPGQSVRPLANATPPDARPELVGFVEYKLRRGPRSAFRPTCGDNSRLNEDRATVVLLGKMRCVETTSELPTNVVLRASCRARNSSMTRTASRGWCGNAGRHMHHATRFHVACKVCACANRGAVESVQVDDHWPPARSAASSFRGCRRTRRWTSRRHDRRHACCAISATRTSTLSAASTSRPAAKDGRRVPSCRLRRGHAGGRGCSGQRVPPRLVSSVRARPRTARILRCRPSRASFQSHADGRRVMSKIVVDRDAAPDSWNSIRRRTPPKEESASIAPSCCAATMAARAFSRLCSPVSAHFTSYRPPRQSTSKWPLRRRSDPQLTGPNSLIGVQA